MTRRWIVWLLLKASFLADLLARPWVALSAGLASAAEWFSQ